MAAPVARIAVRLSCAAADAADDPGLGCPVEYIDLRGTTREKPAVCKYTGNKYWCAHQAPMRMPVLETPVPVSQPDLETVCCQSAL